MNKINRATELDLANGRDWLQAAESAYSKGDIDQARAAAMIGTGYVQLAHTTRSFASMDETAQVRKAILSLSDEPALGAAAEREERAAAEARPHDDEHADDCLGCDGPGVVPCAADEVRGGFAMRDGEPIKDLRGGDRG